MYHEVLLGKNCAQRKCMHHQEGMRFLFVVGPLATSSHKAGTCNYFVADLEIYPFVQLRTPRITVITELLLESLSSFCDIQPFRTLSLQLAPLIQLYKVSSI